MHRPAHLVYRATVQKITDPHPLFSAPLILLLSAKQPHSINLCYLRSQTLALPQRPHADAQTDPPVPADTTALVSLCAHIYGFRLIHSSLKRFPTENVSLFTELKVTVPLTPARVPEHLESGLLWCPAPLLGVPAASPPARSRAGCLPAHRAR